MIHATRDIVIPDDEITLAFVRGSGPGGQNVNKVATAVQLRFDLRRARSLPDEVRQRLQRLAAGRISRDGVLLIEARSHRTQDANRREAYDRLAALVRAAAVRPKVRRPTSVPRGARERRLLGKQRRGQVKRDRRPPRGDE